MKLPKLPFSEKKKEDEYFLSLVLRDEKASAVVFKEVAGRVDVAGEHNEPFKTSLEKCDDEELLNVIDRAVSVAEKSLPEGVESQKTIFGLKGSWIEDGKIKPEKLKRLKKASDELEFKPVGFLIITEALVHLLGKQEGAPVSAIIAEIAPNTLTVTLTKAGKILEVKSAKFEGSIPDAVDGLLKHFTSAEVLPSRIIIFDNGAEKLQQEFIAHKWSHDLGFLHVPQITNLPANFDARAVLSGAAQQMGFDVLEGSLKQAEKEEEGEIEDLKVETEEDKTLAEAVNEFGFSEEDVSKKPKTAIEIDDEIDTDNITLADQFKEIPEENKIAASDSKSFPLVASGLFLSIKNSFRKVKLGKIKELASNSKGRKKLLILIIPIALIILLLVFYFSFRSATVTLGVFSEEKEESVSVTFSENEATSAETDTIKVTFVTSSQDGKVTTAATGTKETGDKAKGTVTIFNNGDSGVTIAAGTVLNSSNDLKFITDKAVTVASASGDIFSGTEPGKENVTVTAEKFGSNYNLPSDTKFTVEGSSSIAAKNDNAFSGGTTEKLTIVSQKDLDKLTEDLQTQLEKDAKEELTKKAGGNTVILPDFSSIEFESKSFSKEVDDESKDVSLTGTITFQAISYDKNELAKFAKEKLDVPDGMVIDEEKLSVEASEIETDDGTTTAEVKITAILVPEIDTKKVAQDVAGSSVSSATSNLQKIPGVEKVNIELNLNPPFFPARLPFSVGKIEVILNQDG